MKKVVVIGSINMDLVTQCKRAPLGGETLFGDRFFQVPGGKGANQAVAIGKLVSSVTMLGKVGEDSFGEELINSLKMANVETRFIEKTKTSSGIAKIVVEENGQNRILVVAGANNEVDRDYVDRNIDVIKECDIVVAQLEIPLETVEYVFKKAKEFGKMTILNPAPAMKLSDEIIKNSDLIIPNESELGLLANMDTTTDEGIEKASKKLLDMGVSDLIVTLGSKGSLHINNSLKEYHKAYKVKAIDTTAAGDSFIGGLISKLGNNSVYEAIEYATKVSAIVVTRMGAQTSIPTIEEVEEFEGVR